MNQRAGMWQNVNYFKQSLSEIKQHFFNMQSNISQMCELHHPKKDKNE